MNIPDSLAGAIVRSTSVQTDPSSSHICTAILHLGLRETLIYLPSALLMNGLKRGWINNNVSMMIMVARAKMLLMTQSRAANLQQASMYLIISCWFAKLHFILYQNTQSCWQVICEPPLFYLFATDTISVRWCIVGLSNSAAPAHF